MNKNKILYTLSCAKPNGSINFVLSLKLDEETVPKPLYFLLNSFSSWLTENLHKQKHFLER